MTSHMVKAILIAKVVDGNEATTTPLGQVDLGFRKQQRCRNSTRCGRSSIPTIQPDDGGSSVHQDDPETVHLKGKAKFLAGVLSSIDGDESVHAVRAATHGGPSCRR